MFMVLDRITPLQRAEQWMLSFKWEKYSTKEWFAEPSLKMNWCSSKSVEELQNSCVGCQTLSIFILEIKLKISQICYWSWNCFQYEKNLSREQCFWPFLNVLPQRQQAGCGAQPFPAVFQHRSALKLPLAVLGHSEWMTKVCIRERVKQGRLERKIEIKRESKGGEPLHPGSITVQH